MASLYGSPRATGATNRDAPTISRPWKRRHVDARGGARLRQASENFTAGVNRSSHTDRSSIYQAAGDRSVSYLPPRWKQCGQRSDLCFW